MTAEIGHGETETKTTRIFKAALEAALEKLTKTKTKTIVKMDDKPSTVILPICNVQISESKIRICQCKVKKKPTKLTFLKTKTKFGRQIILSNEALHTGQS